MPATPNSGSTMLTEGSVPAAQSAWNCAIGARFCWVFLDCRADDPDRGQVGEVVAPADPVGVQAVPDRAVGRRRVFEAFGVRRDVAVGGAGHQEAAVGVGLARSGAEPAVGQAERAGQRVCEGERRLGPVAHRLVGFHRADEAVHLAAVDLLVGRVPALGDVGSLRGGREREGANAPRGPGIAVQGDAGAREAQALRLRLARAGERAEQVVEGVVLHHHDDDVIEGPLLFTRPGRPARVGQAVGLAHHRPGGGCGPPQGAGARHAGGRGAERSSVAQHLAPGQPVLD